MVQLLATRLACILHSVGRPALAILVASGARYAAVDIAAELCPVGRAVDAEVRALAEIVRAWGGGHDTLATDALATWDRADCAACALRVLQGLPACTSCQEAA